MKCKKYETESTTGVCIPCDAFLCEDCGTPLVEDRYGYGWFCPECDKERG